METKFTKQHEETLKMISIPQIENYDLFEKNRDKAWEKDLESCACCGKEIKEPRYWIRTVFGGATYLKHDSTWFADAWAMAVGSECRKRFPEGYVMDSTKESIDFK